MQAAKNARTRLGRWRLTSPGVCKNVIKKQIIVIFGIRAVFD